MFKLVVDALALVVFLTMKVTCEDIIDETAVLSSQLQNKHLEIAAGQVIKDIFDFIIICYITHLKCC